VASTKEKPDYGVDAPFVIRNFFVGGMALLLIGVLFPTIHVGSVTFAVRPMSRSMAAGFVIAGVLMLAYGKWGKYRHRDRILSMIDWKGNESVLDVGTGRGLLMIGAAKRLSSGRAVGIDIWNAADLSGNRMENTLHNADLEGVREKVEVRSKDAANMRFPDCSFDVVLSNLCLHNIPTREGRQKACREIVRVLKPGGTAIISDFIGLGDYARAFQAAGAKAERIGLFILDTFPPLGIVRVTK
jgi:SAM-dependent methyltransferase